MISCTVIDTMYGIWKPLGQKTNCTLQFFRVYMEDRHGSQFSRPE
jgi:hypothetical protein